MSIKESSNNNYKSITIKSNMNSPEEIIDIYKDLSKIDGIIVL
jgi:putative lipoic acid-binding regulatory protein